MSQRKSPGARRTSTKKQSHSTALKVLGMAFFGVVATYIGIINASAVRGDEIRDLEYTIQQLHQDADKLAVEEAQTRLFAEPTEDSGLRKVDVAQVTVLAIDEHNSAVENVVALAQ